MFFSPSRISRTILIAKNDVAKIKLMFIINIVKKNKMCLLWTFKITVALQKTSIDKHYLHPHVLTEKNVNI